MERVKSVKELGETLIVAMGSALQEECWVIGLSTQMQVLLMKRVALGTVDGVSVHPRDIFRDLVAVNAYGFVLAHNHPSGILTLSESDERFKVQLEICSKLMQYHFFDFIVVTKQSFLSQRALGKMPKVSLTDIFKPYLSSNEFKPPNTKI